MSFTVDDVGVLRELLDPALQLQAALVGLLQQMSVNDPETMQTKKNTRTHTFNNTHTHTHTNQKVGILCTPSLVQRRTSSSAGTSPERPGQTRV